MTAPNTNVQNLDVASLADAVAAYVHEIQNSQSADVPTVSPGDLGRINQYVSSTKGLLADIQSRPPLDLPQLDPNTINLNPLPEIVEMENPVTTHIVRLLRALYTEAVNGGSGRSVSGISAPDSARLNAVIKALEDYLAGYVASYNPVDAPESGGSTAATS